MSKIIKPEKLKVFRDRFYYVFAVLMLISYTFIKMLPFFAVFGVWYLITKGIVPLIFIIILVIAYFWLIIYGIKQLNKPYDPTMPPIPSGRDDSDEAAEAAGLIFGAGLLGHHIGKQHGSASDRTADDWLWQEKYRHDDY